MKVFEREQMLRDEGREEERQNTERERQNAERERMRAEKAEKENQNIFKSQKCSCQIAAAFFV